MDRKAVARETLEIMRQGYYQMPDDQKPARMPGEAGEERQKIDILKDLQYSVSHSMLITPENGKKLLNQYKKGQETEGITGLEESLKSWVENISAVEAIRKFASEGKEHIGVLNFASAKNPGGGFINGAMAQEESLAASSTLYQTLIAHEEYYRENRAQHSMMYTDYAIYSPEVTFFRNGRFQLVADPVKASVLTLPAVNMGQVLRKGEDIRTARMVMRRRMALALAVFANAGDKNLVLGAYGCGVFCNDPVQIASWWKELMEEGFGQYFHTVCYAVLDLSRDKKCLRAFEAAGL